MLTENRILDLFQSVMLSVKAQFTCVPSSAQIAWTSISRKIRLRVLCGQERSPFELADKACFQRQHFNIDTSAMKISGKIREPFMFLFLFFEGKSNQKNKTCDLTAGHANAPSRPTTLLTDDLFKRPLPALLEIKYRPSLK